MPFYAVPSSGKKGRDKGASDADAAHLTDRWFRPLFNVDSLPPWGKSQPLPYTFTRGWRPS